MEVRDLFFNVPARRKFLRTPRTELRHAGDAVRRLALARPDVTFALHHDARRVVEATHRMDPARRLARLVGEEFAAGALEIDFDAGDLSMHGFLGPPRAARARPDLQFLFVNGRSVRDDVVRHAVRGRIRRRARGPAVPGVRAAPRNRPRRGGRQRAPDQARGALSRVPPRPRLRPSRDCARPRRIHRRDLPGDGSDGVGGRPGGAGRRCPRGGGGTRAGGRCRARCVSGRRHSPGRGPGTGAPCRVLRALGRRTRCGSRYGARAGPPRRPRARRERRGAASGSTFVPDAARWCGTDSTHPPGRPRRLRGRC